MYAGAAAARRVRFWDEPDSYVQVLVSAKEAGQRRQGVAVCVCGPERGLLADGGYANSWNLIRVTKISEPINLLREQKKTRPEVVAFKTAGMVNGEGRVLSTN